MPDNFVNLFSSREEAQSYYSDNIETIRVNVNGLPMAPNWITCETDVVGKDHWHLRYIRDVEDYESTIEEWGRSLVQIFRPLHMPSNKEIH